MLEIKNHVHYAFSQNIAAVARCQSGETVCFHTWDCYNNQIVRNGPSAEQIEFKGVNPATGPLFIETAKKGDCLKVEILKIETEKTGFCITTRGCGVLCEHSELRTRFFDIEDGMTEMNGVCWKVNPMVGVIGTAPEQGEILCEYSGPHGGNMDCPLITEGCVVYLPVHCDGALLSMGDLHASMGEGEVCGTGIEIAGKVTCRVSVVKNEHLQWPLIETEDAYYFNCCGKTADKAIKIGYLQMQKRISQRFGWDLTDADIYLSLQGKVAANQACLSDVEIDGDGPNFRVGVPKLKDHPLI